ncbi:uncharacterized protein LOC118749752 [Rhagoletis pomonella]|uniref:uncharacterized protein LOC118749752 n=1 Tax=Rhagoletis pomonella TaxID=28610 RepID=UPI001783CFF5|nr:uncharacterized protein LOC118749752 [Rhagoletis pomonella]
MRLSHDIRMRWERCGRSTKKFIEQESQWLSKNHDFKDCILDVEPCTSRDIPRPGRPTKTFAELSIRTRKRKAKELMNNVDNDQLLMAAELKLRSSGKRNSAKIVEELSSASPSRGTAYKKSRLSDENKKSLTPDQAIAMIVDSNLSTHEYSMIRQHTSEVNRKIYPSYNCLKESKVLCYPEKITVTETYAEIELQSLIDHSLRRLCLAQEEVLLSIPEVNELNAIIKWGCDGAEHSCYSLE